mmetsp:Transcript_25258/g.46948  ORF Transcript_25258/g.46948 Transcript_25258/m.46948 type:complete len:682 (-) Transcript_25258:187-2232(-)
MRLYAAAAFVATTLLSSESHANDEGRNVQLRGVGDGGRGGDSGGRFPSPAATASSESLDSPSRNLRKMTGSCTLLEKEVQCLGPDGNGGPCPSATDEEDSTGRGTGRAGRRRRFDCETSDGMIYEVEGLDQKVNSGEVDQILSGKTELEGDVDIDEKAAKMLVRTGKLRSKKKGVNGNRNGRKLSEGTGTRTVLAVRIIANGGSTTVSSFHVSDEIFGTFRDPVNLKSQMSACSNGALNITTADNKLTNNELLATDIEDGVTTVTVSSAVTPGGDRAMVNEVNGALLEAFGVNSPDELANHIMYCLPPGTMTGIADSYINHWRSVYSDVWCTYVSAQMHEIGHNLNLADSGEGSDQYGDQSGMMGYSYSESNTQMCYNSAKSWQLGWYSTKREVYTAGMGPRTYDIYGIASAGDAMAGTVLIKIDRDSDVDLYINFNWAMLHNEDTKEAANLVMIVEQGGNAASYAHSSLLAKLSGGSSFRSTDYFEGEPEGRDVVVSVETIAGNKASITIAAEAICSVDDDCNSNCVGHGYCISGECVCCGNDVCEFLETASLCPKDCTTEYKLACGSSNMPCANQTAIANVDEGHEVRCCSDQNLAGWSKHRGCEVSMGYEVWSQSVLDGPRDGCYDNETHASATTICENAGGRLCTVAELLADCTRKSGCNHNRDMIWSSDYVEEAWQ